MVSNTDWSSREPTEEQHAVIHAAQSERDVAVEALAGTGKTTTLQMLAAARRHLRGTYIAFNRAIVDEARKRFPGTVDCRTAHSLAFRAVGSRFEYRINSAQRMTWHQVANSLHAQQFAFRSDISDHVFEPAQMAVFAHKTVQAFCKSIDTEIGTQHVPEPALLRHTAASLEEFKSIVLKLAEACWADIQMTNGIQNFTPDHYLKMWHLTKPSIGTDFILFDEAQDADPVMLDIVNSQSESQLLYCGDRFQAIYEWRGAFNALEMVHIDERRWLTQSFRFGQTIADQANRYLRRLDAPELVKGFPGADSTLAVLTNPDAILCRTNAGVVSAILASQAAGRRVALLGKPEDLVHFVESCSKLQQGQRSGHPELAPFLTWQSVQDYVEKYQREAPNLAVMVGLVGKFGVNPLLKALSNLVPQGSAQVTVATAHRAKGREWRDVKLHGDFPAWSDMEAEDLRLAYVAVTRARRTLDRTAWDEPSRLLSASNKPTVPRRASRNRPPIDMTAYKKT